ncbi:Aste57867_20257 [Aphanomyces stellatus]|uniref:Aste57867_20257 protein n=1 Tax=Aphanomyces stellatus TaxID=120398 RepID=A0A485LEQ1_9STRA|nr:hypothetical protein As57867_020191 [Aphanomyces stellatus]VFT96947.1 Aste57867_20257 [Aphanomyces stellatus]
MPRLAHTTTMDPLGGVVPDGRTTFCWWTSATNGSMKPTLPLPSLGDKRRGNGETCGVQASFLAAPPSSLVVTAPTSFSWAVSASNASLVCLDDAVMPMPTVQTALFACSISNATAPCELLASATAHLDADTASFNTTTPAIKFSKAGTYKVVAWTTFSCANMTSVDVAVAAPAIRVDDLPPVASHTLTYVIVTALVVVVAALAFKIYEVRRGRKLETQLAIRMSSVLDRRRGPPRSATTAPPSTADRSSILLRGFTRRDSQASSYVNMPQGEPSSHVMMSVTLGMDRHKRAAPPPRSPKSDHSSLHL